MTDQDLFAEADRCTPLPDEWEATLSALECAHYTKFTRAVEAVRDTTEDE